MGESTGTRQANFVLPPRASEIGVYATSSTPASADLRLVGPQTGTATGNPTPGAPGKYVRVTAISADVWVAFGSTAASVASIAAQTAGVNANTGCVPIMAGTFEDFRLVEGTDLFIGYVTVSASGYMTVHISSQR